MDSALRPAHQQSSPLLKQALASACSSLLTALCVNPLVVLKVRRHPALPYPALPSPCPQVRLQTNGGSVASVLSSVVRHTGLRGLWAGCSTALVQSVPNVAVYMVTYENLSAYLTHRATESTASLVPVAAGSLARLVGVTIVSPIERIRTIQASGCSGSMFSIGSNIVGAEGAAGLYRGWPSMVLRDVPFSALYWLCYENCKVPMSDLHRTYMWGDASPAGTASPVGTLLAGTR